MDVKEIIGQKHVIESLYRSYNNNTISHSYIFEGPKGIGKKTVAQNFAQLLMCKNAENQPCGICEGCMLFLNDNHPDIKIISSDKSISVGAIREIIKDISIKPYYGGKKAYIITDAQDMTVEAQNSLLKTLEEPPQYGIIILTVTNSNLLLPTIISRCIIKKFIRNTNEEMNEYLQKNYPDSMMNSELLISLSDGLIGNLKELLDSDVFLNLRKETLQILKKVIDGTSLEAIETEEYFTQQKDNIDLLLNIMILLFRDILIIKETDDKNLIINKDYSETLSSIGRNISSEFINRSIQTILEAKRNLDVYANFGATIEVMLLKIKKCRRQ